MVDADKDFQSADHLFALVNAYLKHDVRRFMKGRAKHCVQLPFFRLIRLNGFLGIKKDFAADNVHFTPLIYVVRGSSHRPERPGSLK